MYLVRVVERQEAGCLIPFTEAKEEISATLLMERKDKLLDGRIAATRQGMAISYNLDQSRRAWPDPPALGLRRARRARRRSPPSPTGFRSAGRRPPRRPASRRLPAPAKQSPPSPGPRRRNAAPAPAAPEPAAPAPEGQNAPPPGADAAPRNPSERKAAMVSNRKKQPLRRPRRPWPRPSSAHVYAAKQPFDGIVAMVDDQIILLSELEELRMVAAEQQPGMSSAARGHAAQGTPGPPHRRQGRAGQGQAGHHHQGFRTRHRPPGRGRHLRATWNSRAARRSSRPCSSRPTACPGPVPRPAHPAIPGAEPTARSCSTNTWAITTPPIQQVHEFYEHYKDSLPLQQNSLRLSHIQVKVKPGAGPGKGRLSQGGFADQAPGQGRSLRRPGQEIFRRFLRQGRRRHRVHQARHPRSRLRAGRLLPGRRRLYQGSRCAPASATTSSRSRARRTTRSAPPISWCSLVPGAGRQRAHPGLHGLPAHRAAQGQGLRGRWRPSSPRTRRPRTRAATWAGSPATRSTPATCRPWTASRGRHQRTHRHRRQLPPLPPGRTGAGAQADPGRGLARRSARSPATTS